MQKRDCQMPVECSRLDIAEKKFGAMVRKAFCEATAGLHTTHAI